MKYLKISKFISKSTLKDDGKILICYSLGFIPNIRFSGDSANSLLLMKIKEYDN